MGGHFKATTALLRIAKTEERDRSIAETVSDWINVRNLFYMSEREDLRWGRPINGGPFSIDGFPPAIDGFPAIAHLPLMDFPHQVGESHLPLRDFPPRSEQLIYCLLVKLI